MPSARVSRVAVCGQVDLRRCQFALRVHQSRRRRLFQVHRPPHHVQRLPGVQQRGQHHLDIRRRDCQPLVLSPARHCHRRAPLFSLRAPLGLLAPAVQTRLVPLLRLGGHCVRDLHPAHDRRYARRAHHSHAAHHHQQRQSVRQSPGRRRTCPQHAIRTHPYHQQEVFLRPSILRPRGARRHLHATPRPGRLRLFLTPQRRCANCRKLWA